MFALSSTSEGLPNCLLEAMACGVPVVATTVGAIPTVIRDEINGLLVSPGDSQVLTLAMNRLLSNSELRGQFAAAGRNTIESRYSFKRRMQKVAAVYDSVLSNQNRKSNTQPIESSVTERRPLATSDINPEINVPPGTEIRGAADSSQRAATDTLALPAQATVSRSKPTVAIDREIQIELTSTPETWQEYLAEKGDAGFYQQAAWLRVLQNGLGHQPACLQATSGGRLVGVLPLAFVQTPLFGRFLVSLPYLNSSGIVAETHDVATALIDRAVDFAEQLDVRYLELRHETAIKHSKLTQAVTDKVHMRLALPETVDELWDSLKSKLRSQVRKPLNNESLTVHWGTYDLLDEFYSVFTQNMRDLGTPPFSRQLFASMLNEFPDDAEFCCVRLDGQPVASGLLIHGPGVTQVPSASSLRKFNTTSANMLMYWHLLSRSIERGQTLFDFGRSSKDAGTHKFKAQWGAEEFPAVWQHFVREGAATDMRPNSGKYDLMIRTWQKLPVWLTKIIGPSIVRGIP